MKMYTPRYTGTVTKYVFVESPEMTPSDLAIRAYEISQGVMIKETCFGLQVTGKEEDVNRIIDSLRALDPTHIFVKDRGFRPGIPAGAGRTSVVHVQGTSGTSSRWASSGSSPGGFWHFPRADRTRSPNPPRRSAKRGWLLIA